MATTLTKPRTAKRRQKAAQKTVKADIDMARDEVANALKPQLVYATELLGEVLATLDDTSDGTADRVSEINATLWAIRWDLGIIPEKAS